MENKNKISEFINFDLSKMVYATCFSSVSFNGYKLDILKSGVQKYLRRREFNKMVWCVGEIYLFQVYAKSYIEKKAAKGIISNLINRLIIMLDEEILFAECENYLLVRRYIEDFEKSNRNNFECLFKICHIMCQSKMIRRNSDIRSFWSPLTTKLNLEDDNRDEDEDEDEDEYCFKKFKEKFEENKSECFIWMFKIFYRKREGKVIRYRRRENIYMIWKYLFDLQNIKDNEVLQKCLEYKLREFYKKNRSERFIFLTSAIDIAMHKKNDIKNELFNIENLMKNIDNKFADINIIKNVYENWNKMKIDDYAIDMHTSLGRKMGKNKVNFIMSGCQIIDEDKEYFVKEWRDHYNNSKMQVKTK